MFAVVSRLDWSVVWTTANWDEAQWAMSLSNHWEVQDMHDRAAGFWVVYMD